MNQSYHFVTEWKIEAPLEQVWHTIYDSLSWPQWWRGVKQVIVTEKGDEHGLGEVRTYHWKSILPYSLSFKLQLTEKIYLRKLAGIASGELEGNGIWLFEHREGITYVQYQWTVITTKYWMNRLAFILKPLFKYNHNIVMEWGAKGLAKKLQANLISY